MRIGRKAKALSVKIAYSNTLKEEGTKTFFKK